MKMDLNKYIGRSTRSLAVDVDTIDEAQGIIEGYVTVYGVVDSYGTYTTKGCANESIKKRGKMPMLWQHTEVIGLWTEFEEDEKGLKAKGKLTLEDPNAQRALAHLKAKSVEGLSIGFTIDDYNDMEYNSTLNAVALNKIDLREISVVTFPANDQAQVTNVKNENGIINKRQLEKILRDAGLSKSEAMKLIACGYNALDCIRDEEQKSIELFSHIFDKI